MFQRRLADHQRREGESEQSCGRRGQSRRCQSDGLIRREAKFQPGRAQPQDTAG